MLTLLDRHVVLFGPRREGLAEELQTVVGAQDLRQWRLLQGLLLLLGLSEVVVETSLSEPTPLLAPSVTVSAGRRFDIRRKKQDRFEASPAHQYLIDPGCASKPDMVAGP
jgi:hypothetical protein